ncbi:MAG: hypothetical protein IPL95_11915 [Saprospiraceae bacterium]|nr:hypothetical protein [Saprospiraceae bacterium]
MKFLIYVFFSITFIVNSSGNINFIDFAKVSNDSILLVEFGKIKGNQHFYDHWSPKWKYDLPKQNFSKALQTFFTAIASITNKSTESYLLLGDIAHYLYNLDEDDYFNEAVKYYNLAIENNASDYRNYWFLGNHFAQSNEPILAIENFSKSKKLVPNDKPIEFWNDFAFAAYVTNMPTTCRFAMDMSKTLGGKQSAFDKQFGNINDKRIVKSNSKKFYLKSEIWEINKKEMVTFTSRPLGAKITINPNWRINVLDYVDNQSAFIIHPPSMKLKEGKEIGYSIAIMFKSAKDKDNLADYLSSFVSSIENKSNISFSDKYENMIAYEIIDKTKYSDQGGGHMYVIGIERMYPKYPGLLLEEPYSIPENANKMNNYKAIENKDRFSGKIFYALILDSSEAINEQSLKQFKTFFNEQLIIE